MTRRFSNACLGQDLRPNSRSAGGVLGRRQPRLYLPSNPVRQLRKGALALKLDVMILAIEYRTKTQSRDYEACLDDYRSSQVTLQHFQNSNMGFDPSIPTEVTQLSDAISGREECLGSHL